MHVLILTSEYGPVHGGGLGTHVTDLVGALQARDMSVTVGITRQDFAAIVAHDADGEHWSELPMPRRMADPVQQEGMSAELLVTALQARCERGDWSVIHSHDRAGFLAGKPLADSLGIPLVSTVHWLQVLRRERTGGGDLRLARIEHEMCTRSDYVITVSAYMKDLILRFAPPLNGNLRVIHNWIDPSRLLGDDEGAVVATQRRLAPRGEAIVLFLGRPSRQKGLDLLLNSSDLVTSMQGHVRWVIAGESSENASELLRGVCAAYEPNEHVQFLGKLPRGDIGRYLRAATCIVVPSRYEPFGLTALEAMAARCPVIVSDIDGLRELVEHEVHGLRVPMEIRQGMLGPSVDHLAEAQMLLLTDEGLRVGLADRAVQRATTAFGPERALHQILNVYREVSR